LAPSQKSKHEFSSFQNVSGKPGTVILINLNSANKHT